MGRISRSSIAGDGATGAEMGCIDRAGVHFMAQTTPRKRVTREDIRKREIKLDIAERTSPPPLSKRLMTPIILPIALWFLMPERGALWFALTATALWIGVFGMLHAERKRSDFEVGREIALSIVRAGTFGIAIAGWAFLVLKFFAA